jgi:hypothetical protein
MLLPEGAGCTVDCLALDHLLVGSCVHYSSDDMLLIEADCALYGATKVVGSVCIRQHFAL